MARYSEPGTWSATVVLVDAAANATSYTPTQLASAGLTNSIQQSGNGDTRAPDVVSLSVSPSVVDTSLTSATLTFSARFVDDLAGVSNGAFASVSQVVMRGPTGTHRVSANLSQRVSGSSTDGVYTGQATVPRYSEQGQWTLQSLTVYDNVGNARTFGPIDLVGASFSTTFTQSGIGDIGAPSVAGFTVTPTIVDTSVTAASVTLRARLTDSLSGLAAGVVDSPSQFTFRSPSGSQTLIASFGLAQLQSGNALDGWYTFHATLPQASEQGTWTLASARLVDVAHNAIAYDAYEWSQLGFPASFDVHSDGTPSEPTNVLATSTASSTIANVSWLPPAVNGSGAVTSYTVTSTPDGLTATTAGTNNTATVSGLTRGVTYTFTVHATNAAGDGTESDPSNFFVAGGTPDTTAPALVDLSIAPVAVEATSGPATVSFDLSVTDDVAGLADGTVTADLSRAVLTRPDGSTGFTVTFPARQQVAGTAQVGTYRDVATLPQNSATGTWVVQSLVLVDGVGHTTTYSTAQLQSLGASTTFVITDAGTPGPPLAVSATAGDTTADVSWVPPISDGSSPVVGYTVVSSPGNITTDVGAGTTAVTMSGLRNGTSYTFVVRATNAVGTGVASARSNAVVPGTQDQIAPQLQSFSISPLSLAPSTVHQSVTVGARIVDAGSGASDVPSFSTAMFVAPDGSDAGHVDFSPSARIAGTINDGTYAAALSVPGGAMSGVYQLSAIVLVDRAGNQVTLSAAQVQALGFPTSFTVTSGAPPDAPTAVSATAGDGAATVSWIASAFGGTNGPVIRYTVTASPGGMSTVVDGATTTATVTGLTNGVAYTFTVSAANALLSSAPSLPSNAVTPGGSDVVAPQLLSLVVSPSAVDPALGPVTVDVSLQIADALSGFADTSASALLVTSPSGRTIAYPLGSTQRVSGDAIDGVYSVPVSITAADEAGLWLVNALVLFDAAGNATTIDTPGLAAFPARSFVVAAGAAPSAPSNVLITRTTGGINVSWNAPSDAGSSPISGYLVKEMSTGAVTPVGAASLTLFVSTGSIPKNATVSFTVAALNGSGQSVWSTASDAIVTTASGTPGSRCVSYGPSKAGAPRASGATVATCTHVGWAPRPKLRR